MIFSSNKKMPQAVRVELMRQVQMMTGVLCAVMVENFYAVILVHVFSICSAMYHPLLIFQGKSCSTSVYSEHQLKRSIDQKVGTI